MIARIFYTIPEAIEILGGSRELLNELFEFHGLKMYAKFKSTQACHIDMDSFDDTLKRSGQHGLTKWHYLKSSKSLDDDAIFSKNYCINGWFELSSNDVDCIVRNGKSISVSLISYLDGLPYGTFFQLARSVTADQVRIKPEELNMLILEKPSNSDLQEKKSKPLREDREQNLLKVIAALWEFSELSEKHNVAADRISGLLSSKGFEKPAANTIADTILKKSLVYKNKLSTKQS